MDIVIPASVEIEEVYFNLASGADRIASVIIDGKDLLGAQQADYGAGRIGAYAFLDLAILAPGNVNLILQYAVNSTPAVATPTLAWSDFNTVAVAGGSWGGYSRQRLTSRFSRIKVTDTSLAANNGIYLWYAVRTI